MNRCVPLFALLAACDPIYDLTAKVTDPDGEPIEDASLALVRCVAYDGSPLVGPAALTDAAGSARVGGFGFQFPFCDITIAAPGFASFESSFDELCDHHIDDCDRVQTIDVILEPF